MTDHMAAAREAAEDAKHYPFGSLMHINLLTEAQAHATIALAKAVMELVRTRPVPDALVAQVFDLPSSTDGAA
jgi:hypothetical protein